ncbi:MAG: PfkB family carbohydrate kinase, partial [SAR324 cluster bacterium]|nr:PfkB family carbohydrate kinase [SAR324 cluster bacterium]
VLGVSPPDRFPLIFYRENCADMQISPQDADPNFFRQAKALQFTGTGVSTDSMAEATRHAVDTAKACGCAVILDIDYRPVLWGLTEAGDGESRFVASEQVTRTLQPFLFQLDLIIGTEEEVLIAGGSESLEKALEKIRSISNAVVVLKRGEKGCEVYPAKSETPVSARPFPIEVLNILGAGDAFASGFLRGWLRGESLQTCALWGNANGALTVTRHGCSPSMASFEELQYFIKNFDQDPNILESPKLLQLHQRTVMGQPRKHPMLVLAFDHRSQFQETCQKLDLSEEKIPEFKELVFEGFRQVEAKHSEQPLAILVDPQYGSKILEESAYEAFKIGVPIEKAGIFPTEWLCEEDLYQHLQARPSEWFVKLLWKFHPDLDESAKKTQMNQLKRLDAVCRELDRRLMLELILPEGMNQQGECLAQSMAEVYQAQVYPFWWKIAAPEDENEWEQVTRTLDKHDPQAGVILLGKNAPIEDFAEWFRVVRSSPYACGFAIGRSIFWQAWLDFASGKLASEEIPDIISQHYLHLIELWDSAKNLES